MFNQHSCLTVTPFPFLNNLLFEVYCLLHKVYCLLHKVMYLLLIQPNTFILGDLCTRVLHSLALICTCSHLEFERMSIFLVFSFITVSYLYLLLFISCFLVPMASLFRFYSFFWMVCVCVLVTQSCPTLCNPMDYSQLGSSGPGILQARILE